MQDFDVIVVGAGVAGASLATVLGRNGKRVLCVERDLQEPDRIVGELLQPGGCRKLVELGLEESLKGIDAQNVFGYGIFLRDKRTKVYYLPREQQAFTAEQAEEAASFSRNMCVGRSFHNGRFVKNLRNLAMREKLVMLVEGNVCDLILKNTKTNTETETDLAGVEDHSSHFVVTGVKYKTKQGNIVSVRAPLTIVCDGCFSRFRSKVNKAAEFKVFSYFVGLVLENCTLPYPNFGHVILGDPAPVLFYPISSTETRCLVDIPSKFMQQEGGSWTTELYMRDIVAPQLPDELREAFLTALSKGKYKMMPNRVMPARPASLPGVILLGDSFNMRHPLTGGGMTVALSDIFLLNQLLSPLPDFGEWDCVDRALREFYRERRKYCSTINILANALYSVFCATGSEESDEMRSACFDYLSKGGRLATDPVSMLGGLQSSPYLLLTHFFAVALYGCGRQLKYFPNMGRIRTSWCLFRHAFNIVKPLIDDENVTFLSKIPISHI
ncbi:hypothetical protein GpartN1_g3165.t1 [Galdieria partita]|uniref:Squalene monooxygenase n=1 Tax=Galdieria partita TaxID=83374 RepID=A0A9C7PWA2_9RHOD|nr:hypothetical protein GpartN1_g3165.t1 [Galdieria partita]